MIDTTTNPNKVVATVYIPSGNLPSALAVTPDGKHVYVTTNLGFNGGVYVIDTATNTLEATVIMVGTVPGGVAITPDGKYAYVMNFVSNTVSVIDTASNTVVGTPIPVGTTPAWVAVTPDGKHVYVTNNASNNVSVIDTATNMVVATVPVGSSPLAVGIIPPPPGVPFLAFNARLQIDLDRKPKEDSFELKSHFTLSSTAPAINPVSDPVTLQIGTFATTIPPGSFKKIGGSFIFVGVIEGVGLKAQIRPTATIRYAFEVEAKGASLAGTKNPVYVTLAIGGDSGATSVAAHIR